MSFFGRKTAAVVGITPSDQFVAPHMSFDKARAIGFKNTSGEVMSAEDFNHSKYYTILVFLDRIANALEKDNELYEQQLKDDEAIDKSTEFKPGYCGQIQPHSAHTWVERYSTTGLYQDCSGHS